MENNFMNSLQPTHVTHQNIGKFSCCSRVATSSCNISTILYSLLLLLSLLSFTQFGFVLHILTHSTVDTVHIFKMGGKDFKICTLLLSILTSLNPVISKPSIQTALNAEFLVPLFTNQLCSVFEAKKVCISALRLKKTRSNLSCL